MVNRQRCNGLRSTFRFLFSSFSKNESPERQTMNRILQNRAWIFHIFVNCLRIAQFLSDKTYLSNLDTSVQDRVSKEQLEVYGYIWIAIVCTFVLLDILCYKWRSIAQIFFTLEMISNCFVNLVQFEETCQVYQFQLIAFSTLIAVFFLCGIRVALVTLLITMFFIIVKDSMFTDNAVVGICLKYFAFSIPQVFLIMAMSAIFNKLSYLQTRSRVQVDEYFNLINRMREGVIVLLKGGPNAGIKFCNKSAEKIFDKNQSKNEALTLQDLNEPRFLSCKMNLGMTENSAQEALRQERASEQQNLLSLDQIIDKSESTNNEDQNTSPATQDRDLTIYRVSSETNDQERFTRIRVERIEFESLPAVAIYFEEMTKHVQMMRLESQIIQQRNEAQNLESYTSMMSHEFRTPLSTCLMFIEMLLQRKINAEVLKILMLMKSSIGLLISLINDIVDLKLIKENCFKVNQTSFDPKLSITFVKELFTYESQSKKLDLSVKFIQGHLLRNIECSQFFDYLQDTSLPKFMFGDELRLKQALINLVKNAIKFTKKGYVQIVAGYDFNACLLRVHVRDSGIGIAKEEIPQLCNKFGKLLRTAQMNADGIGLGLMISKALIEKNRGELEIHSDGIGKGSIFAFSMKMQEESQIIQQNSSLSLNHDLSNSDNTELVSEYERLLIQNKETKFIQKQQDKFEDHVNRQVAQQSEQIEHKTIEVADYQSIISQAEDENFDIDSERSKNEGLSIVAQSLIQNPINIEFTNKDETNQVLHCAPTIQDEDFNQILIIDNDCLNVEAMNFLLQQFNLRANYANDAPDAYAIIQSRLDQAAEVSFFSLIVVDYSMPNIDGFQCSSQIRGMIESYISSIQEQQAHDQQNLVAKNVTMPFICMLTAYNNTEFLKMANQQADLDCVLTKPIFKEQLHELLVKAKINLQ